MQNKKKCVVKLKIYRTIKGFLRFNKKLVNTENQCNSASATSTSKNTDFSSIVCGLDANEKRLSLEQENCLINENKKIKIDTSPTKSINKNFERENDSELKNIYNIEEKINQDISLLENPLVDKTTFECIEKQETIPENLIKNGEENNDNFKNTNIELYQDILQKKEQELNVLITENTKLKNENKELNFMLDDIQVFLNVQDRNEVKNQLIQKIQEGKTEQFNEIEKAKVQLKEEKAEYENEVAKNYHEKIEFFKLSYSTLLNEEINKITCVFAEKIKKIQHFLILIGNKTEDFKTWAVGKNKDLAEVQENFSSIKGDYEQLKNEIYSLKSMLDIKNKDCEEHLIVIKNLSIDKENLSNLINKTNQVQKSVFENIKQVDFQNIKKDVVDLGNSFLKKFKNMKDDIAKYKTQLENIDSTRTTTIDALKKQIDVLETDKSREIEVIEQRLKSVENENVDLKKELTHSKVGFEKICSKAEEMKEELELKESLISDLNNQIADLDKTIKYYTEALKKSDNVLQDLKNNRIAIEFGDEIEKLHRKYNKEIACLNLKLQEYEEMFKK